MPPRSSVRGVRAEVISVGTELLLGDIVNANAAHIGRELARVGIDCLRHVCVGDNEERIARAIEESLGRADAVILTGGLGPTQDDVTREAIARVTGRRLLADDAIAARIRERFRRMGRDMPESNLRQAEVPEGATPIDGIGTAPGLIVEHGGRVIYAVPGVPAEMREMVARIVLADLQERAGGRTPIVSRVVRTAGLAESAVADALAPLWGRVPAGATIAFLAGGGEVRVRITVKAPDEESAAALLDDVEREVRAALGPAVMGTGDETLEVVAGRLLRERGWTVACAESLTGGLLGARITQVPGASEYFRGSVVAYATEVKRDVLGVDAHVLADHGPVSAETAAAMARGARGRLGADVGLALTGVAGPTELGAPVGTVFLAVDGPIGAAVRGLRLPGDRETIRTLAAAAALNLLRLYLLEAAG